MNSDWTFVYKKDFSPEIDTKFFDEEPTHGTECGH